jgi:Fe-S oxidoreductase/nitrate reductase gamma subunit
VADVLNQPRGRVGQWIVNTLAQPRTLRKPYAGLMHALIFWGVTIQIIGTAIELVQDPLFIPWLRLAWPRGNAYLAFEAVMDTAGLAILLGVLMALGRRLLGGLETLETRPDDLYALGILVLVPLVGFTLEGMRLLAVAPPWAGWSYVGNLVAGLLAGLGVTPQAATDLHAAFWWLHVAVGLTFIASIPFTKLRHLVTGPVNIALRSLRPSGELTTIEDIETAEVLGAGRMGEFTTQQLASLDACVNCGRCQAVCPATLSGQPLNPRTLIQGLRAGMYAAWVESGGDGAEPALLGGVIDEQIPWLCTTCGACMMACPLFINPVDEIMDMRRHSVLMLGSMPSTVGATLQNLERRSNPWGMPPTDRMAWAGGREVPIVGPGGKTDVLLFGGCATAFDARNQKVIRTLLDLLDAAGVDYAMLGDAEQCCGETARRLGHEWLFQVAAQANVELFGQIEFERIVTPCPHCFNTFRNEYPKFGGNYKVQHHSQLLAELLRECRLPGASDGQGRPVVMHDSCYLGRYNGVFDQPRRVLQAIAGVQVREPGRSRENGFCCGGGGGQMWMETDPATRINQRRLDQLRSSGADVVATACPYCLIMLDDAVRVAGLTDQVAVADVAELYREALQPAAVERQPG